MPLPATLMMSMGAIGIGVLAFVLLVGFSRPQAMANTPNRDRQEGYNDNGQIPNNSIPRRPIVCNDCSICQDEIERFQEVMQIRCGHRFHSYCLKEWLRHSHTCPTCRCMALSM